MAAFGCAIVLVCGVLRPTSPAFATTLPTLTITSSSTQVDADQDEVLLTATSTPPPSAGTHLVIYESTGALVSDCNEYSDAGGSFACSALSYAPATTTYIAAVVPWPLDGTGLAGAVAQASVVLVNVGYVFKSVTISANPQQLTPDSSATNLTAAAMPVPGAGYYLSIYDSDGELVSDCDQDAFAGGTGDDSAFTCYYHTYQRPTPSSPIPPTSPTESRPRKAHRQESSGRRPSP